MLHSGFFWAISVSSLSHTIARVTVLNLHKQFESLSLLRPSFIHLNLGLLWQCRANPSIRWYYRLLNRLPWITL